LFSGHQKITARDNNGAICHSNQNHVWDYTTGLAIRRHHYPAKFLILFVVIRSDDTKLFDTAENGKALSRVNESIPLHHPLISRHLTL
jgi:hypothetical protein